jgi:high-affinity iron transporter
MTIRPTLAALITAGALALTACAAPIAGQRITPEDVNPSAAFTLDSSAQDGVREKFDAVEDKLGALEDAARRGDYASAQALHAEAYALYESGPDKLVDNRDPALAGEIDEAFGSGEGTLLSLIQSRAAPDRIAAGVDGLKDHLDEAAAYSAASVTGTVAAFNSAAIILREGLEAVLILAVILGYMRTTRRAPKYARLVLLGVVVAVLLSLLTWWVSQRVLSVTSANRELLEGATSLLAVAVLFYCTNWLFHKAYVIDWMTFVKAEAGKALATGSALGLAALGFTVVYREGFETVLFYQAMLFNADPAPVLAGLAAGVALLALITFGVLSMSVRLPVRPFFTVTGALMIVLGFKFAGLGIHALQEAHLVGETLISGMGQSAILRDVLGIYPTVETLAAQALLVVGVGVTFTISRWQWKRAEAAQTA